MSDLPFERKEKEPKDPNKKLRDLLAPLSARLPFRTGMGGVENPVLLPGLTVSRDEQGRTTNEPMPMQETRQRYFESQGVLPEQRQGYVPRLSEHMHAGIRPIGYSDVNRQTGEQKQQDYVRPALNFLLGRDAKKKWDFSGYGFNEEEVARNQRREQNASDAWKLYLGMPQEYNTFRVSDHKPSVSKNPSAVYLSFSPEIEEMILTNQATEEIDGKTYRRNMWNPDGETMGLEGLVNYLLERQGNKSNFVDSNAEVMGNYSMGLGRDEKGHYVSYYDKWDLDVPNADKLGTPFEIYGRIYYDPATFRRIRQ